MKDNLIMKAALGENRMGKNKNHMARVLQPIQKFMAIIGGSCYKVLNFIPIMHFAIHKLLIILNIHCYMCCCSILDAYLVPYARTVHTIHIWYEILYHTRMVIPYAYG